MKSKQTTSEVKPGYLRREDAAVFLGVSTRTVSDWQRKRIIPFVQAGRKCILFPVAGLDAAMQRFTVNAIGAV
jgi:excisionase family DNA binding protein